MQFPGHTKRPVGMTRTWMRARDRARRRRPGPQKSQVCIARERRRFVLAVTGLTPVTRIGPAIVQGGVPEFVCSYRVHKPVTVHSKRNVRA